MRTFTQKPLLIGLGAGLIAALFYSLVQDASLNCLILLGIVALAVAAGVLAASGWVAPPPGSVPPPSERSPTPPNPRGDQVRAAAIAGALTGLGLGVAGLIRIIGPIFDPALAAQIDAALAQRGAQGVSSGPIITVGFACGGVIVLLLFPAIFSGLGALGGYIWTALRPAPRA